MTGVGPRQQVASGGSGGGEAGVGWGGLPPSIVQVPVLVVEGHPAAVDDTRSRRGGWREIPLRYTPFGERRAPRRTAPHQPRLDWQMCLPSDRTQRVSEPGSIAAQPLL